MKVLFVCLGNICRSPLAEALFRHKINEKKLTDKFSADSCGTADYHIGQAPDERTIRNALKNGVPINHACRQLTPEDLVDFDRVVAMDKSNYNNIMRLPGASHYADKIFMMRVFDPLGNGDVPDPYSGGAQGFQDVFDILDRSVEALIEDIIRSPDSYGSGLENKQR